MTAKVGGVLIHTLDEVVGLVQLTNWLPGLREELAYLVAEQRRISADKTRTCKIVQENMQYALFVNDMTNGAFDRLNGNDT